MIETLTNALRGARSARLSSTRCWMLATLTACAASDPSAPAASAARPDHDAVGGIAQALSETVPTSTPWVARHGMTGAEYQREFDAWTGQGFRPTSISAYNLDGTPYFAAIWENISGPDWVARHGLTGEAYQQEFDSLAAQGFRPTVIEGYEEGGEARYAAIWEQRSSGPAWVARHGLTHAEYQQEFDTLTAQGFRATWLQGYGVAGTEYYAGIWEQREGPSFAVRHGMSADAYQTEFTALAADQFRPLQISAFAAAGTEGYAGIWEQSPGPFWTARHNMTSREYQHVFVDHYLRGLRLKQVEGNPNERYAAFWEAEPEALSGDYCDGARCFSLDKVADALTRAIEAGPFMKYSFELRRGTTVIQRAKGQARTAATPPATDFTVDQRYNPASVGKSITTVATLQLLNKAGLSVDTLIHTYLPSSWNIPANNRTITFAEVLSHTSGFRSGDTDHEGVKRFVETEIKLEDKVGDYQNGNYALLRILDARLAGETSESAEEIARAFSAHVRTQILEPLGIYDVSYQPSATPVLFYPQPPGSSEGTDYGDWTLEPGSAGPHLSTHELTVFVDALFKETLLPAETVQLIRDRGLGFEGFGTLPDGTSCRGKGGFFPGGPLPDGGNWNGGAELSSALVHCDNGVSAMVVVNGMVNSGDSISNALQAGF